jgi:hypothetical protein
MKQCLLVFPTIAAALFAAGNGSPAESPPPDIPRHYPHIRIAMLAYNGNPMGPFEDELLRRSVDLVVPHPKYLQHIHDIAPRTPQLAYTNTSNLYLEMFTDWLNFADRKGLSREAAFYHAATPKTFRGDSPSSQPVAWFWSVLRGANRLTDATRDAHSKTGRTPLGESVSIGQHDPFREINFSLTSGALGGWSAAIEYVRRVDAAGKPTEWSPLKTIMDTTSGLTQSGQLTFDPPADWKPAALGGATRLYYVRLRPLTGGGGAPVAQNILGRDYVAAGGKTSGVIPVFDAAADKNKDGYLNDAEYETRAPGKDARFLYESRIFSEGYGQMRFATNPANPAFRQWAVDYHQRLLTKNPLAGGFFMDNSEGKPQVKKGEVLENPDSFAKAYGALLKELHEAIAPRWILGNTGGGGPRADPVLQQNPAYLEEFAIRPLAHHYVQFEDLASQTAKRAKLTTPSPLAVLDSHPQKGVMTDPRMLISTLAYYYLLADPERTFLMFFGGFEPASPWTKHWTPAVAFDVGRPTGPWEKLTEGADPSNADLRYRIYQRGYTNALVMYKPLSYKKGAKNPGTSGDETATRIELPGTFRPLHADGTLGAPATSISLRNGEGAVLTR